MTNKMTNEWVRIDNYTFIREIEKTIFEIIDVERYSDKKYLIAQQKINLNDFNIWEINNFLQLCNYQNYESVKKEHKEKTNQVIAEIIYIVNYLTALRSNSKNYKTKKEVDFWLRCLDKKIYKEIIKEINILLEV